MWISLSYCGFNAAIYVACESRHGAASVGFAMVGGTLVVSVLYLLLNAFFVLAPQLQEIAGQADVAAIAARVVGGIWLERAIRVAICLGLVSSVSSTVMSGPRVYAKMASDGCLPRFFVSHRSPPTRSVLLQGAMIAIVVCFSTLVGLLSYLGMTLALSAAATVATLFFPSATGRSDRTDSRCESTRFRGLRLGLAGLYVLATLTIAGIAAWNKPWEGVAAIGTITVGSLVYFAGTLVSPRSVGD